MADNDFGLPDKIAGIDSKYVLVGAGAGVAIGVYLRLRNRGTGGGTAPLPGSDLAVPGLPLRSLPTQMAIDDLSLAYQQSLSAPRSPFAVGVTPITDDDVEPRYLSSPYAADPLNPGFGERSDNVIPVQSQLKDLGYYNGPIDGVMDAVLYEAAQMWVRNAGKALPGSPASMRKAG